MESFWNHQYLWKCPALSEKHESQRPCPMSVFLVPASGDCGLTRMGACLLKMVLRLWNNHATLMRHTGEKLCWWDSGRGRTQTESAVVSLGFLASLPSFSVWKLHNTCSFHIFLRTWLLHYLCELHSHICMIVHWKVAKKKNRSNFVRRIMYVQQNYVIIKPSSVRQSSMY